MSASQDLRNLVFGFRISQAIFVAAELNISDLLANGPHPSSELARLTDTDEDALRRLLRTLAALGVYEEGPADTFANTNLGDALRSEHPDRVRDIAAHVGRPYFWNVWGQLLDSVRTGQNTFERVHGVGVWEYRATHRDDHDAFDRAMTAMSLPVTSVVAAALDVPSAGTVVDVGGGQGALLAAVLRANPDARGILFDKADVVARASRLLGDSGVGDRCDVVGGSFRDAVPQGGDVYVLKSILHDWGDDDAIAILRVCRAAMAPGCRLVLVERLLAGPNEGLATKVSDLNMLVMPGGRERSLEEYERLLVAAGIGLIGSVSTTTDFYLIEGVAT